MKRLDSELLVKLNRISELRSEFETIQLELERTPVPALGRHSVEDLDDAYQERLEYNWWKREQLETLDSIESELKSLLK